MTTAELLGRVRAARAEWDTLVAAVPDEQWAEPGVCGTWSLRDVVAHVSWFEREMIELLRTRRLEGSDLWLLPPHERNDAIYRENRERSLADVRAESARLRAELLEQLATLTDAELADAAAFPPMPPDWQPADIFAQNTYEHYTAHAESLVRWRAARESR